MGVDTHAHLHTHTFLDTWGRILVCIKHGRRARAGGAREIGRTSADGQKVYGNDPDNERRPQGVESERERARDGRV